MNVADLEGEAWDSEKPAEVVNADHVSSIFSSMSSICAWDGVKFTLMVMSGFETTGSS
jgi:hypothetical protein